MNEQVEEGEVARNTGKSSTWRTTLWRLIRLQHRHGQAPWGIQFAGIDSVV